MDSSKERCFKMFKDYLGLEREVAGFHVEKASQEVIQLVNCSSLKDDANIVKKATVLLLCRYVDKDVTNALATIKESMNSFCKVLDDNKKQYNETDMLHSDDVSKSLNTYCVAACAAWGIEQMYARAIVCAKYAKDVITTFCVTRILGILVLMQITRAIQHTTRVLKAQKFRSHSQRQGELGTDPLSEQSTGDSTTEWDIKHNGDRYEVGLPWKGDIGSPVKRDYELCLARLT
eukprot:gene14999-6152_t